MLSIQNLCFSYGKSPVLRDINFHADANDFICVLGENGAGKTTLFRCILGLLRHYTGQIFLNGQNSKQLSAAALARLVAYIPQAHAPSFNYSVFQTVLMGTNPNLQGFSTPRQAEEQLAQNMLEQVGISHLASRGYAEISGGERQLVLVARALAQQSKILIMDEPTSSLDYGNQFRVLAQVKELARQGYLVLLSTHNPEHALLFGSKVLIIQNGQITHYGEPKATITPEVLQQLYHIPVDIHHITEDGKSIPVCIPKL